MMIGARALSTKLSPTDPRFRSFSCRTAVHHRLRRNSSLTVVGSQQKTQSLEEHYQRKAPKYWDSFYKRHKNKFFKDRHYLEKDWREYFCDDDSCSTNGKVVLEVNYIDCSFLKNSGKSMKKNTRMVDCGTGNSLFPLVAAYPKLYVHACDNLLPFNLSSQI